MLIIYLTKELGYDGELPREDGDTSDFSEFDIYYKDILINDMSYDELDLLIKSEKREERIDGILGTNI